MGNIVDKYFDKKKKDIFEYSKIVNTMLKYDNNQIWNNEAEFNSFLKSTISYYVDNYYFKSLTDFEEYNEYLGPLVKCDDRFKTILVCAIDSIKEEFRVGNYKLSSYIITLIVYTSVVVDRFTYPYNKYQVTIKNVSNVIESMFKFIAFVKYESKPEKLKNITKLIRVNNNNERKFFNMTNTLNNDNSKNEYESIDNNSKYYKVLYKYKIEELDGYSERELRKYFKRVSDDLIILSFSLSSLTALKICMLNKDIKLLFPVNLEFYEKDSEINKLSNTLENKNVKSVIKLYASYNDTLEHKKVVRDLENAGFEIAINVEDASELSYSAFDGFKLVFVNEEFVSANKTNMDLWKENMEFVVKNKGEIKSELQMLDIKEEM